MTRVAVYLTGALLAIVVVVTAGSFALVAEHRIASEAMHPTLPIDSRVWVRTTGAAGVSRGDIVVWTSPGARAAHLSRTSKAQAEQIRSVAIDRVGETAGRLRQLGRPTPSRSAA